MSPETPTPGLAWTSTDSPSEEVRARVASSIKVLKSRLLGGFGNLKRAGVPGFIG
jgi:hypothetical protein